RGAESGDAAEPARRLGQRLALPPARRDGGLRVLRQHALVALPEVRTGTPGALRRVGAVQGLRQHSARAALEPFQARIFLELCAATCVAQADKRCRFLPLPTPSCTMATCRSSIARRSR